MNYTSYNCNCCGDSFDKLLLVSCHNNPSHILCHECFIRHIDLQIESTNASLDCVFHPNDKCNGLYDLQKIKFVIKSDDKFEKYIKYVEQSELHKISGIVSNFQCCPHCSKFGLEIDDQVNKLKIICQNCSNYWCNLCRKEYHEIENCYYLTQSPNTKIIDNLHIINNIIAEIITKSKMNCPHCKTKYIKEDGCNLITCSKCKCYSCYICNEKIFDNDKGNHYYHFIGHPLYNGKSSCELYTDVIRTDKLRKPYLDIQILNELTIFLESNKDNIELFHYIYSKIIYTFNDDYDIISKLRKIYNTYLMYFSKKEYEQEQEQEQKQKQKELYSTESIFGSIGDFPELQQIKKERLELERIEQIEKKRLQMEDVEKIYNKNVQELHSFKTRFTQLIENHNYQLSEYNYEEINSPFKIQRHKLESIKYELEKMFEKNNLIFKNFCDEFDLSLRENENTIEYKRNTNFDTIAFSLSQEIKFSNIMLDSYLVERQAFDTMKEQRKFSYKLRKFFCLV